MTNAIVGIEQLHRMSDKVDTGIGSAATSRALIVFNLSDAALSGIVCFPVDMPWRVGFQLPPVAMKHLISGEPIPCLVSGLAFDSSVADNEKVRLTFDLLFAAAVIPAMSYDTYIAEYIEDSTASALLNPQIVPKAQYRVVETLRHSGTLPPSGPI